MPFLGFSLLLGNINVMHVPRLFTAPRKASRLHNINVMHVPRLFTAPRKASRLLGSAFVIQSPLQDLANIEKDMTF
jgi:hypothetical protein